MKGGHSHTWGLASNGTKGQRKPWLTGSVALLIKRRSFPGGALSRSFRTDHPYQRKKLFGERHCSSAVNSELGSLRLQIGPCPLQG
jgi:hypothetical protein